MNYQPKTCPRCKAQLRPAEGAFELIRKRMVSPEADSGLTVTLYSCPQCGYIELYNLNVTGHI